MKVFLLSREHIRARNSLINSNFKVIRETANKVVARTTGFVHMSASFDTEDLRSLCYKSVVDLVDTSLAADREAVLSGGNVYTTMHRAVIDSFRKDDAEKRGGNRDRMKDAMFIQLDEVEESLIDTFQDHHGLLDDFLEELSKLKPEDLKESEEDFQFFFMRAIAGYSLDEIAEMSGTNKVSVSRRAKEVLPRIFKKLNKKFDINF